MKVDLTRPVRETVFRNLTQKGESEAREQRVEELTDEFFDELFDPHSEEPDPANARRAAASGPLDTRARRIAARNAAPAPRLPAFVRHG